MSASHKFSSLLATATALALVVAAVVSQGNDPRPSNTAGADPSPPASEEPVKQDESPAASSGEVAEPGPTPEFVNKGLIWLAESQHPDGGWGGGSHAHQDVLDPHAVPTDPATTAFVATALLRAGHTPSVGQYKDIVRKATEYLCAAVESSAADSPKITALEGTQPQSKLGPLVDTTMATQYLARVLPKLAADDKLRDRVDKALDLCLAKLDMAQQADGSWNIGGGWAPVLQSSLGCQSYELAEAAGKTIDTARLEQARDYQKGNFDAATGAVTADAGAGVALYALSSSQRANAAQSRAAEDIINEAKREGKLAADAPVSAENLEASGVDQSQAQELAMANSALLAQNSALGSEDVLAGFGNSGGEEFLSYLFTSESLVIQGGDVWTQWNGKMHDRLAKVQNPDGSWSGHHCITSPVFCTAAAVQCLTADRDSELLIQIAKNAARVQPEAGEPKTSGP
jgi:hypothetical protein